MTWKSVAQGLSPRALWLPGEVSGGVVTDESTNSYDATNNGGTASGTDGPGPSLDSFMAFDGVSNYLDLTTLVGWDVLNSTIGIWMRSTTTAFDVAIMAVFNDGSNTALSINNNEAFDGSDDAGKISVFARNDGSSLPDIQGGTTADTILYDGNWHFLVLRLDLDAVTPTITARIDKNPETWTFNVQDQIASGFANFGHPLTLAARNLRGTIDRFADMDVAGLVLFDTNLSDADADALFDAASPVSVSVGTVTETEASQAISIPAAIAEIQLSGFRVDLEYVVATADVIPVVTAPETEAAQAISVVSGAVTIAVGTATESEVAQAIDAASAISVQVGSVVESEAAQTIASVTVVTVAVDPTSESEQAQTITAASVTTIAVGAVLETEQAQIIGISLGVFQAFEAEQARIIGANQAGAPQSRPVDPVTETEAAQAISIQTTVTIAVGVATEVEAAQTVPAQALVSIQVATITETELAQIIGLGLGIPPVFESEAGITVDSVQGGAPQSQDVVFAGESETGEAISVQTQITIAVVFATETDSAQIISLALGILHALESEQARIVGANQAGAPQSRPVDFAAETELAQVINGFSAQSVAIDPATESEQAGAINTEAQTSLSVQAVSEVEEATTITILAGAVSVAVTFAAESDQANPVSVVAVFLAAVNTALESDLAQAVGFTQGAAAISVVAALETEAAQTIVVDDGIVGEIGGLRDPDPTARGAVGSRTPVLLSRSVDPL